MAYIDSLLERGLDIDTIAPYFSFVMGVDMDFFESIAKIRASRKIWAKLMRERYGANDPGSHKIRIMGSPGTMSLTLQQPLNNIARLGIMMLAFSLEGATSSMWPLTAVISIVASTLFSCLELFVAFLQAFIFTFLSALFIGMAIHHH